MDIESIAVNVYTEFLHAPGICGSLLACYIAQLCALVTMDHYINQAKSI